MIVHQLVVYKIGLSSPILSNVAYRNLQLIRLLILKCYLSYKMSCWQIDFTLFSLLQAWIKSKNRDCENLLRNTEMLLAVATVKGILSQVDRDK